MSENRVVTPGQLIKIRVLDDFDLIMLISEIHDHGWDIAQRTLDAMPPNDRHAPRKNSMI